jgi:hypothetical protein
VGSIQSNLFKLIIDPPFGQKLMSSLTPYLLIAVGYGNTHHDTGAFLHWYAGELSGRGFNGIF